MVNGYNFTSLIESINNEFNNFKASTSPILIELYIDDIYTKLDGLQGFVSNKDLSLSSFTFFDDTANKGVWSYHIPDIVLSTYSMLMVNSKAYHYAGTTILANIPNLLYQDEQQYSDSFTITGETIYFTVDNTGPDSNKYLSWIDDAATLSGITDFFTKNPVKVWYKTKTSDTLTITIPNVNISVLTANTFHANATNDLAEYRIAPEKIEPGFVVKNKGEQVAICKTDRSKMAIGIVSDTSNMTIGDKDKSVPIAISGRVLAYYEGKLQNGDLVCSTKNGKVRRMSKLEVIFHPELILGKVISIPEEETWHNIKINNRVWIQVR